MSALPSPAPRVLVIDDEALLATAITRRLSQEGYACRSAETLAAARQSLIDDNDQGQTGADIVLLDMRLPDGSGLDLLGELSATGPDAPPVIVVTAFGDVENAVAAMKLGAADYLRKPIDLDELIMVLDRVRAGAELRHQLEYSRQRDHHALEAPVLLGDSAAMVAARDKIDTVAAVETPDGASPPTVLITGETGTGKDVAARLIHLGGGRPQQPFIHVDCAALPAEMVEAELFGHVRGAFPGARSDRTGLIEAAEAGTLFLDEIGAFPADLQAKLLNVIERHRARRIGASREMPVRARFVAATNRQLADMVDAGTFRSDLYYRLNVLTVEMPPLRDCSGDVAVMAADFAAATARRYGRPAMEFDPAARAALTR
jgi:DNA-binding NtrC family response regulator